MKVFFQRWRTFLNTGRNYYIQSTVFLVLLLALTPILARSARGVDVALPAVGLVILGLRAAEERSRRAVYDLVCVAIWLAESLILLALRMI